MNFGAVGWQPTALKTSWGLETRGLEHSGAVGWQPTQLKATMEGLKYWSWRELEAFWGCRLATYST